MIERERIICHFCHRNSNIISNMKSISSSVLLLVPIIILSCSSRDNILSSSDSRQVSDEIIEVDKSYMEAFDICEEVCTWYESDEDMYEMMPRMEADAAFASWNNLKAICSRNDLYKARDLMTSKEFEGKLLIYLRNSTAQYHYFSGIKYQILLQVDPELAQKEIVKDLDLCLAMTDTVIGLGKSDSVNVPPHYWNLFTDYLIVLVNEEEYDSAEALPDRLYEYCILDGMSENQADCRRSVLQAIYTCMTSDSKTALKTVNKLYTRMENDPELAEDAETVRSILMEEIIQ